MAEASKILSKTLDIYLKYGIKSITMDDVARELGMSKKTLYEEFDNKADLVTKTMQYYIDNEKESITRLGKEHPNSIDEMLEICRFICNKIQQRNKSLLYDLRKYHADSWELFKKHKAGFRLDNVIDNTQKGIKQGLYRNDFSIEIVAKIYISRLELVIDHEMFPIEKYDLQGLIHEMVHYHLRGIATPKGLKYLMNQNVI